MQATRSSLPVSVRSSTENLVLPGKADSQRAPPTPAPNQSPASWSPSDEHGRAPCEPERGFGEGQAVLAKDLVEATLEFEGEIEPSDEVVQRHDRASSRGPDAVNNHCERGKNTAKPRKTVGLDAQREKTRKMTKGLAKSLPLTPCFSLVAGAGFEPATFGL